MTQVSFEPVESVFFVLYSGASLPFLSPDQPPSTPPRPFHFHPCVIDSGSRGDSNAFLIHLNGVEGAVAAGL